MTIDDIFSKIGSHMVQGIMTHEQLMNCYLFLGLKGYAKCQEYHYISETKSYAKFCRYKVNRFSSLVKTTDIVNPQIIPATWYGNARESVNSKTRTEAMAAALDEWIRWEESAVSLYQESYKALLDLGDIATADFINKFILDAEEELTFARNEKLRKLSIGFDIVSVMEEQQDWKKKYKKLLKK